MMNSTGKRMTTLFGTLLLLTLSLAFAMSALLTDFWIQAELMRRNGTESRHNQMNSGLFHGARQLDWAFGPKRRHFSVYDELQSGVGFMDRHIWFGGLLSAGLGVLWNVVGIFVAMRNAANLDGGHASAEKKKNQNWTTTTTTNGDEHTALGPLGICLWAVLSGVAYALCVLLFEYQFRMQMQLNVLRPEELSAGFSSTDCIIHGFSFWLMLGGALPTQLCAFVLQFWMFSSGNGCSSDGNSSTKNNKEIGLGKEKQLEPDDSVFIY